MSRGLRAIVAALLACSALALIETVPGVPHAHALVTLTVDSRADTTDGLCARMVLVSEGCTLREAIATANNVPGQDLIQFAIPGTGVQRIALDSALPAISDPVIIDGYTQAGARPNNDARTFNGVIKVEIDAGGRAIDGLKVKGAAPGTVIRGLAIYGSTGVYLTHGDGIFCCWNSNAPISILDGSRGVTVAGNLLGTNAAGVPAAARSKAGLLMRASGAADVTIGGPAPSDRNVVGHVEKALEISGVFTTGVRIQGNLLGVDRTGNTSTNVDYGVSGAGFNDLLVGGPTAGARNLITARFWGIALDCCMFGTVIQNNYVGVNAAGNAAVVVSEPSTFGGGIGTSDPTGEIIGNVSLRGITVWDRYDRATRTIVQGNRIGTDATGENLLASPTPPTLITRRRAMIGGASAGQGNVVAGTIQVVADVLEDNCCTLVYGNRVGISPSGTTFATSHPTGIEVIDNPAIVVGGREPGAANIVTGPTSRGVVVTSGDARGAALIQGNSIYATAGIGIDLGGDGVTSNDPLDADSGPNGLQNRPSIVSAAPVSGGVQVAGTLSSAPSRQYLIDVYASPSCDPSGLGEGKRFLDTLGMATDANGNGAFSGFVAALPTEVLTVTAVDDDGNWTSEFSNCRAQSANTADMQAYTDGNATAPAGSDVFVTGSIRNGGPDVEPSAQLRIDPPDGITIQEAYVSSGTCDISTGVTLCEVGPMGRLDEVDYQLIARIDDVGTFALAMVASGAATDPNLSNNAAVSTLTGTFDLNTCTILGTAGPDTLTGTSGDDVICGLPGNDTINGAGGNDVIWGGPGVDTINGELGNDTIRGGDDGDSLIGSAGNDLIRGGAGSDSIDGGSDNDSLYGDSSADIINGNQGDDRVEGGSGDDIALAGGNDRDTVRGGPGNDTVHGNAGPDFVAGGAGNDHLFGDGGNDTLNAKDGIGGNDTLDGGIDTDTCSGDAGPPPDPVTGCP